MSNPILRYSHLGNLSKISEEGEIVLQPIVEKLLDLGSLLKSLEIPSPSQDIYAL